MAAVHAWYVFAAGFCIVSLQSPAFGRPDCLFDNASSAPDQLDCIERDTTNLRERNEVKLTARGMGLDLSRIVFLRCPGAHFATQVVATAPQVRISIIVPLGASSEELLAPLVHELAHAYQLQSLPDVKQLRARFGSAELELGADYAAGFIIRNVLHSLDRGTFQRNLRLIGDYDKMAEDWHGCPENRTFAFRTGFYLPDASIGFQAAYQKFHASFFNDTMQQC